MGQRARGDGDYSAIGSARWDNTNGKRPFAPVGGSGTLPASYTPLYNGNIAHTVNSLQPWGGWTSPTQPAQVLAQVYRYDQLNRLKQAQGVEGLTATNTWDGVTDAVADRYKSQYTYDANGNIETVARFDETGTQYDNLQYHYEKNGAQLLRNRLYHLNETIDGGYGDIGIDASTFHAAHADVNALNNYKYDELGNLIADKREEIANIEWTVNGKVKRITRTAGSTKPELWFTYGADGQRISKSVGDPLNGGFREYYLRDAQGNVMAMYKYANNGASLKVTERPVYGNSRIGSYTRQLELMGEQAITTYPYIQPMQAPLKRYELTDHLGNVNTVVTGRLLPLLGPGVQYQAEVVSAQGYGAFGALLPGRNYSSANYRFGFNGKENDNEVYGATGTFQDYGMRAYDTRLGRFISVDPLAAKYPYFSCYEFASNHPIKSVDIDGKEVEEDENYERLERFEELRKAEEESKMQNAVPVTPEQLREMAKETERFAKDPAAYERARRESGESMIRVLRAEQVRNAPRTWETQNPGPNQTRTTEIEGTRFRVNSGHGFDRVHRTGGFETTGLSRDQVENGIVNDIMTNVPLNTIPNSPSTATPFQPYTGTATIEGVQVGYTAVNVNGEINIGTYYPMPAQGGTTPQNAPPSAP